MSPLLRKMSVTALVTSDFWVYLYSLLALRGWQVLVEDLAWLDNHGHWLLAWCELLRLLVMEFAFHEREIPEQI